MIRTRNYKDTKRVDNFMKDKVCHDCNKDYSGTASSKYCVVCRDLRIK